MDNSPGHRFHDLDHENTCAPTASHSIHTPPDSARRPVKAVSLPRWPAPPGPARLRPGPGTGRARRGAARAADGSATRWRTELRRGHHPPVAGAARRRAADLAGTSCRPRRRRRVRRIRGRGSSRRCRRGATPMREPAVGHPGGCRAAAAPARRALAPEQQAARHEPASPMSMCPTARGSTVTGASEWRGAPTAATTLPSASSAGTADPASRPMPTRRTGSPDAPRMPVTINGAPPSNGGAPLIVTGNSSHGGIPCRQGRRYHRVHCQGRNSQNGPSGARLREHNVTSLPLRYASNHSLNVIS